MPEPNCTKGAHWWRETLGGGYDGANRRTTRVFACVLCGTKFESVNGDFSFLCVVGTIIQEVKLV